MGGKYFEAFEVGETFKHEVRRTVTDMDNILFSSLTYNPAAIHIDHEYAKTTEFGKPLINSILRSASSCDTRKTFSTGWRRVGKRSRGFIEARIGGSAQFG